MPKSLPGFLACLLTIGIVLPGCGRTRTPTPSESRPQFPEVTGVRGEGEEDEISRDGASPGFHFPDDVGGALLAKTVSPPEVKTPLPDRVAKPRSFPPPPGLTIPDLALPPAAGRMPTLPAGPERSSFRPQLLLEDPPLAARGTPPLPEEISFFAPDRVRVAGIDASLPMPLPVLAQPVPDRASLEDPTLGASTQAALRAPFPDRSGPAPWLRLSLPDPFENHRWARLPSLPAEESIPRVGSHRKPIP